MQHNESFSSGFQKYNISQPAANAIILSYCILMIWQLQTLKTEDWHMWHPTFLQSNFYITCVIKQNMHFLLNGIMWVMGWIHKELIVGADSTTGTHYLQPLPSLSQTLFRRRKFAHETLLLPFGLSFTWQLCAGASETASFRNQVPECNLHQPSFAL